jgi:hypothetical protein
MNKKTIGIVVCMLLIAAAVLPAVGIRNVYKSTKVEESISQDKSIIETQPQGLLVDNDWLPQDASNTQPIYHMAPVGIGTTSPGEELHIEGGDGITAIRLVETMYTDSVWELRSLNDEGMGQNQFAIYGGEDRSQNYHLVISPNSGVAIGTYATARGDFSTAIGHNAEASETGSMAIGTNSIAKGITSTAIGNEATAIGDLSTAIGNTIIVEGEYSVGIGLDISSHTVTPDNVMSIMGGNVGIGKTAPSYLLDVSGGAGIVAQFSGRVKGADAVNDNEFVTKSQVKSVVTTHYTPTGTSDSNGDVGDTAWDDNYFYVKTPDGWKRAELETWESTPYKTSSNTITK